MKKRLTVADLSAEFLRRIRLRQGCERISKVILEGSNEYPDCNWAISVIDACEVDDPSAIDPACLEVYEEMAPEFESLTVH